MKLVLFFSEEITYHIRIYRVKNRLGKNLKHHINVNVTYLNTFQCEFFHIKTIRYGCRYIEVIIV